MAAVAYLLVLTPSAGGVPARPWRSLLGSTEVLAPEVSAAIERVLAAPTLERQVHARSARTPLDVYLAFLDAPELTAAAARFLKLASTTSTFSMTTAMRPMTETERGGSLR